MNTVFRYVKLPNPDCITVFVCVCLCVFCMYVFPDFPHILQQTHMVDIYSSNADVTLATKAERRDSKTTTTFVTHTHLFLSHDHIYALFLYIS